MRRRWWIAIAALAPLTILVSARAQAQQRPGKASAPTLTLIATCYGIQATGKRRQTWIFQFKVLSVIEGRYEESFIDFELPQGGHIGGEKVLATVGAKRDVERGDVIHFDRGKKIELTFESRSSKSIQRLDLRSFRSID